MMLKTNRKIATLLLTMASVWAGYGQAPMAQAVLGDKGKQEIKTFMEEENGEATALLRKGNKYYLKRYDSESLEVKKEMKLGKLKYERRRLSFEVASVSPQGYHFVCESYSDRNKSTYIVEQLVTRDGQKKKPRILTEISPVEKDTYIQYAYSRDSSKILIYKPPVDKREPKFSVLDRELNLLYERVIHVPVAFEELKITNVVVTNDGDVLVVAYEPLGRERDLDIDPASRYVIAKISADKETVVYDTPLSDRVYHYLTVQPDLKNNIVLTATYSDQLKGEVYGVQYIELDARSMQPVVNKTFSTQDVESDISEDLKGRWNLGLVRQKSGLMGFKFTNFARYPNGNIVAVGERDFFDDGRNHVYGEILAMCFNPQGELVWVKVVDKIQNNTLVPLMNSYAFHDAGVAIYLYYNDDLRNAERIMNGERAKMAIMYGKNFGLIGVRIAQDGDMTLDALVSKKDSRQIIWPRSLFGVGAKGAFMSTEDIPVRLKF